MKRVAAMMLLLAMLLSVPALAVETLPEEAITVEAPSAVLMEKETGALLYAKDAYTHRAPASVTKVMTMLLVVEEVESGRLRLSDTVTASANAAAMGGSQIWLEEGEQMSVEEMLKCVAVASANDCAVALAEHIAGSEEAFVARMNARVAELGLSDTHFTNCTGLFDDADHYTCAYDLAVMSRALLQYDWIKDFTTIWMDTVREGAFGLSNTNKLIRYYDGATGLKTGFTSEAMYCLAASAMRDGVEYIAVVLHGETSDARFESAKTLLNYAFANYTLASLQPSEALPPVPVELGEADAVQPVCQGDTHVLLEKGNGELDYEIELAEGVTAPVEAGQQLGTLTVRSGGEVIAQLPLVAENAVERQGLFSILKGLLHALVTGE